MGYEKNEDGTFSVKVSIDAGRSYQFGYSIDGRWNPDTDLELIASPFGTSNSVLDLTQVVVAQKDDCAESAKKRTTTKKVSTK